MSEYFTAMKPSRLILGVNNTDVSNSKIGVRNNG